jgi:hypothetical protein
MLLVRETRPRLLPYWARQRCKVAAEAVLKNCIKLRERSNKYIKKGREWISEVVNQTGLMALSLSAGREVENRHTISSLFLGEVCSLWFVAFSSL